MSCNIIVCLGYVCRCTKHACESRHGNIIYEKQALHGPRNMRQFQKFITELLHFATVCISQWRHKKSLIRACYRAFCGRELGKYKQLFYASYLSKNTHAYMTSSGWQMFGQLCSLLCARTANFYLQHHVLKLFTFICLQ